METDGDRLGTEGVAEAVAETVAIVEIDPSGQICGLSAEAATTLGFEETILGRPVLELFDPGSHLFTSLEPTLDEVRSGARLLTETVLRGNGNRKVHVQLRWFPFGDNSGRCGFVIEDRTIPTLRENELQSRLSAIDNNFIVAEYMPDGMLLSANTNFELALDCMAEQIVCQEDRTFMPPEAMTDDAYAEMWQSLANGIPYSGEFHRKTADGRDVYLQGSYNPIPDPSGTIDKVVLFATDITQRKSALEAVGTSIRRIRAGSLDATIAMEFDESLETLRNDFNDMVRQLAGLVQQILTSTDQVLSSSTVLSRTSESLSLQAAQQSDAVRLTETAVDTIADRIAQTQRRVGQGSTAAQEVEREASLSLGEIAEATAAMAAIENVHDRIDGFARQISKIAMQSKFLGLNASVEAARAGESGRGFSVVATEVRSLAIKTAEAATEINELVQESTTRVSHASKLIAATHKNLAAVIALVERMRGMIAEIDGDGHAQAEAVTSVKAQVSLINGATAANARLAEDCAGLSTELRGKSSELSDIIAYFELSPRGGSAEDGSPSWTSDLDQGAVAGSPAEVG